ncbi:MAG: serpin family protein [Clostridiales bacterium]|nr:serpin family protein [Clostridiales bacterium]
MKRGIAILLLAGLMLTACQKQEEQVSDIPVTEAASYKEIAPSVTDLGFRWIKQKGCRTQLDSGQNVMVSPLSLYADLAMAMNGAEGDTLAEALDVMGAEDVSQMSAISLYGGLKTVKISNSIWVNESYGVLDPDFVGRIHSFRAEAASRAFNEKTCKEINQWVEKSTNGMIKELLKELDPNEVMHLLNAVCFEGTWNVPYEDYAIDEEAIFTNCAGVEQTITGLNSWDDGRYFSLLGADCLVKDYADDGLAFVAMLPPEGTSPMELLDQVDGQQFTEALTSAYVPDSLVSMIPEFKFDCTIDVGQDLQDLGMKSAFEKAEFTKILKSGDALAISAITQKTHIELDRRGTKAAAVTDIVLTEGVAEIEEQDVKEVILDRPFAFAIVDLESGIPLFLGIVQTIGE